LLIGGSVVLLALISYQDADRPFFFRSDVPGSETHNIFGRAGATLAEATLQAFGATSFLFAILVAVVGGALLRESKRPSVGRIVALGVLLVALAGMLQLAFGQISYRGSAPLAAGGLVGDLTADVFGGLTGTAGAWILCSALLAGAVILVSPRAFRQSSELAREAGRRAYDDVAERWRAFGEEGSGPDAPPKIAAASPPAGQPAAAGVAPSIAVPQPGPAEKTERPTSPPLMTESRRATRPRSIRPQQTTLPIEPGARGYTMPPLDLLNEPEPQTIESEQELLERAHQITEKLQEFAVGGSVVAVHPGPVVTTFEFKPDAGVKYSKITSMTDDLSLALKAESVRIDRMPGRSTVGIEVPNRRQETIFPKDLIGSERFRSSRSRLTLALGKDITGDVFAAELERMPHLLIAGATGAGKSVGLNGMIVSLLYKATPQQLRFIMIDTKMIELGVYADIPHLLIPVVTEPKKAATALKWAVREMEQRYRKLASVGVRNLAQFNGLLEKEKDRTMPDPKTGEDIPLAPLPYVVIVIDELADLMIVSSSEVEEAIMRLAQMARAVGIHLILATQRPSVDVLTGTIKANFPSRIAFRVSQRVDSRTIIDQQGAEHLLGRGDMLYMATGSARVIRLHGGFITEPELNRITSFIKKVAQPVYDESVLKDSDDGAPGGVDDGERDEMYAEAVRTVVQEGKCSITLIQRRLQLGYARAARIVDIMEREGVVSAGEGSKPREILVGPEILESLQVRQ
jgi:S-DNA-T family DNA segregation ATPase FtsK/SpoIIIE